MPPTWAVPPGSVACVISLSRLWAISMVGGRWPKRGRRGVRRRTMRRGEASAVDETPRGVVVTFEMRRQVERRQPALAHHDAAADDRPARLRRRAEHEGG